MANAAWIVLVTAIAMPGLAATPPGPMMANVYRLTEAAAILDVCSDSPAYRNLPGEKVARLQGLVARLDDLVRNIAKHYKDDTLHSTFLATRERIAAEDPMKGYVKNKYQYCGDQLFLDMEAYVAENELLINGYVKRQSKVEVKP